MPQSPDSLIQPLFTMNKIMKGIVDGFLAAATIIADTTLDDYQALEKLDLVEGAEFEDQMPLLCSILAKVLKPFYFKVVYQDSKLTVDWHEEMLHGKEHPFVNDTGNKPESLLEFFFGGNADIELYELPNDGSQSYRLRSNLLRKLSFGVTTVLLNFPGDNSTLKNETTRRIGLMEEKYNAYAVSQYSKSMKSELATVPDSFEKAVKSARCQLAHKLNGSDVYIDLLSIQAEETVKVMTSQLEDMLRSHLSCEISVTLETDYVDEPDGYVLTHIPDEASLEVLSMLMSPKLLSHDIKKLVGKFSFDTAIYKNLHYPCQSIVLFEGIGLSEITLATHIVIHIDTARSI